MKALILIVVMAFGFQSFAQNEIEEKSIQNVYTSCKSDNFIAQSHMNAGIHHIQLGQHKRAINKFNLALEKDATLCDAYYLLGYAYQQMGDFDKSIEYCSKSIENLSNNPSAYTVMAYSHLYLNNKEEAVKNFQIAKEIGPQKIDPYYGLALTKYHKGDYADAMSELNQYDKNKKDKLKKRDFKALAYLEEKLMTAELYSDLK